MKTIRLTKIALLAATLIAAFWLQACNTVDGLGEDVSAGADAVSQSAAENKRY